MRIYLLAVLGFTSGFAQAACEDMYFWARMLQPGQCTPRTEYEKREIAIQEDYRARAQANTMKRQNAELGLTRSLLAKNYGVDESAVQVSAQRTRNGFGTYSINNGQFVCQENMYGSFGCLDTGGHYAPALSDAQLKYIRAHSWDATINENGDLVAKRERKKSGRKLK